MLQLSLPFWGKLRLLLSLPEQKQSERQIESLCSPLGIRPMCSTIENQSEKRENEMLAVPCVIFWAYESIFWFRADIKMDFIFVQKLRQMLFGSVNSFLFSSAPRRLRALRRNLRSSQVKPNKYEYLDEAVKRTASKDGSDSAACTRTLQHDRCVQAGYSTCRSLLYISAVWCLAVRRNSLGHLLIKPSPTLPMSFQTEMSTVKWKFSIFRTPETCITKWIVLAGAIFARLALQITEMQHFLSLPPSLSLLLVPVFLLKQHN